MNSFEQIFCNVELYLKQSMIQSLVEEGLEPTIENQIIAYEEAIKAINSTVKDPFGRTMIVTMLQYEIDQLNALITSPTM